MTGAGPAAPRRRTPPWRTLSGRVALGAVAGRGAASLVFTAVAIGLIRSEAEDTARAELDRQARAVAGLVSVQAQRAAEQGRAFQAPRIPNLEELAGEGTRLYYVGIPLSPGAEDPTGGLPPAAAAQISEEVLIGEGVQRIEFDPPDAGSAGIIAAAAPVVVAGRYLGAVVMTRPTAEVASNWRDILPPVMLAAGIGLLAAVVLVLWTTRRATRPLRDLETAAGRVAGGDLGTEVVTGGPKELDEVAHAFNAMVRELARRDQLSRDFLMRVTHDLRTPLTAIRGHAAALADGVVPQPEVPRSLGAIEDEAARLDLLVSDLIDLAKLDARRFRLEVGSVEPAAPLLRAHDALATASAAAGVTWERDVPELVGIVTDAARMQQIVANLLDNALRWTPPGGRVVLRARSRPNGGVLITVSDTGPGVPTEEREAVFEPFHSLPAPDGRQGSGLGLAISRQLARALGGDLTVGPAEGGGARFTLVLPREAPDAPAPLGDLAVRSHG